jgi:hypothetical protein
VGVLFEVVLFVAVFDAILAVAVAAGALGAGVLLEGALGAGVLLEGVLGAGVLFIDMMLGYELLKSGERYYKGGG